ncbi:MAG: hypothetical protein DPW16_21695 [Chloroflexi bacterium]|nr:hypothetical protein [Chloroflexota bacterium]
MTKNGNVLRQLYRQLIRGLHIQLLFVFVVPTAIILMVVTVGSAILHQEAMQELVGQRDARATQAAADNLAERLHQREVLLSLLATDAGNGQDLPNPQTTAELFDYGLFIETADNLSKKLPSGEWDWRTVGGDMPTFIGHFEHQVLVVFSASLSDQQYLYGIASLESLGIHEILDSLVLHEDARAYLLDEDGHILFDSEHMITGNLASKSALAIVRNPKAGYQQGHSILQSHDREDMIIGYSPIPRLQWSLVVEEPWHAVTTSQLQVTHSVVLVFVLITLLGLLVFVFSLFGVIRPLQRLKVKAGQLVKGDFSAIAGPVGGIQEIEDLQTALVEMARAVQQAQSRLHGYIGAITTAQEDERTRLARDLHDDTVQTLISLNQQVQMAQRNLERDPLAASARLTEVRQISQQAIEDIRRMIHGLRPSYLAELGLASALEMLAEQENSVVVTFQMQGNEQRLSDKIELALYRITQEALSNIRKHSQASQATIQLTFLLEEVRLSIQDNGCGFDLPSLQTLPVSGHYGLVGIRERTQLIGANLQIQSQKEQGTKIYIQVPLATMKPVMA